MSSKGYFNSRYDAKVVNNGGFFCEACLIAKPIEEQSPDPRYCQGCHLFLLNEAELIPLNTRPAWIPKRLFNAPQRVREALKVNTGIRGYGIEKIKEKQDY